jgi:hypothetical protein
MATTKSRRGVADVSDSLIGENDVDLIQPRIAMATQ